MISIDMLPDDVLLEIFDLYVYDEDKFFKKEIEEWQTLVHVCRRWRSLVFGSPLHLDLRLFCTAETPARDTLDVWPSLPLLIRDRGSAHPTGVDDIIAVLERSNRVVEVDLFNVYGLEWETVLAAMQVPFPALTRLLLNSLDRTMSVFPDSFLGRSAPRLQFLELKGIPFPGLPKLLLSATRLVNLHLKDIPHSGYFSPEAMVTALSTLTSLEKLSLEFESPRSHPDRASPPPLIRSVLPALTYFSFKGVGEYLDDFVAHIDATQLRRLEMTFFNQIVFDSPHFIQFINRIPTSKPFKKARVCFTRTTSSVSLLSQIAGYGKLEVQIRCIELDWQVSSMEQVCTSCLPPLSTLEDLYIYENPHSHPVWQDNIEDALWLELLQPFATVKNLYLSGKFASRIMRALQELVGGRSTEVLPTLQNIYLEELQPSGAVQACIQQFVATRRATGHPIAVSRWDTSKQDMRYY